MPAHHKVTARVHRNTGVALLIKRYGIHSKLTTRRRAIGTISLGINAITITIMIKTLPAHHKITVRIHGDTGVALVTKRFGIHPKLTTRRRAIGTITLGIDAITTIALSKTFPAHHKITVCVHGDTGFVLVIIDEGIHQKLIANIRRKDSWNTAGYGRRNIDCTHGAANSQCQWGVSGEKS